MGKHTDKLFITHSEWAQGNHSSSSGKGTASSGLSAAVAALPFWTCSVSQQPIDKDCGVCDAHGNVFDIKNIMPYIMRSKMNPVTRESLASAGELTKLKIASNDQGKYIDPVSFREFQPLSTAVVIKSTGNVYLMSTIKEMCLKPGNLVDLVTEAPFTKSDVLKLKGGVGVLKKSDADAAQDKKDAQARQQAITKKRPLTDPNEDQDFVPTKKSMLASHHMAASLTSTSADINTKSQQLGIPLERLLVPKKYEVPGYVVLSTSLGDVTIELWPKYSPIAVYNFVALARSGYYDGTIFHRNVRGFMIQGGDPSGTGMGGKSADAFHGKPLKDEANTPYKHDARGILSMANKGKNTATSQFFITYRRTPHLDGKHTIFGKVVKNLQVLDAMERVPVDSQDRPTHKIVIKSVRILEDPFEEKAEEIKEKEEEDVDDSPWLKKSTGSAGGVGKYLAQKTDRKQTNGTTNLGLPAPSNDDDSKWKQHRKQRTSIQKSSFSGW